MSAWFFVAEMRYICHIYADICYAMQCDAVYRCDVCDVCSVPDVLALAAQTPDVQVKLLPLIHNPRNLYMRARGDVCMIVRGKNAIYGWPTTKSTKF